MNLRNLGSSVLFLALSVLSRSVPAASEMLYVADPAMNMIYGQPLDGDTTNSLVPITGSVTIVADFMTHLSAREIAFVPNGEARVVLLDLETRALKQLAAPGAGYYMLVGAGTGPDDFLWLEADPGRRIYNLVHATRNATTREWQLENHALDSSLFAANYGQLMASALFTVSNDTYAMVANYGKLYLYRAAIGELVLLNTMADSSIVRGPNNEILQYQPGRTTTPVVFDAAGNRLAAPPVASAPLFASKPQVVAWRVDQPQLAGVTRSLGELLTEDTLDTTATITVAHTTRDENGSVIPERDITGAATLLRVAPDRWHFFNEPGGFQVLNTTTHQVEYQLQYTAGSGPEFSSIDAIAMGPDDKLYVLDAESRLIRVTTSSGKRELLKTFEDRHFHPFIHVRADGTIVLVEKSRNEALGPQLRLVLVRAQGSEWVAEQGVATSAPVDSQIFDIEPTDDGVRTVWRDTGTHLSDITTSGTLQMPLAPEVTAGAPVVDGTIVRFRFESPGTNANPVATVRIRWNYKNVSWWDEPTNIQFRTATGSTVPLKGSDIEKTFRYGDDFSSYEAFVRLPQRESSQGVWFLDIETKGLVSSAASVAANFRAIPKLAFDPLDHVHRVMMPPAGGSGMTLVTRFPATLIGTDDGITTMTTTMLGAGPSLSRIADSIFAPDGTVLAAEFERLAIWRIDPATGAATSFVDAPPLGLERALIGRNGRSFVTLTIGKSPTYFAPAGWVVN